MRIHFVALGAAALIGLAACGSTTAAALPPEASALTAVGFTSADLAPAADPSPSASGSSADAAKRHPAGKLRRELGRHVEHGEVVVQTKDGDKTIDVQRGTVTAVTSSSVTVKSTDGFSETWAFGSPLRIISNRTKGQVSDVKSGIQIGIAGVKNGSTVTANLIVIPKS